MHVITKIFGQLQNLFSSKIKSAESIVLSENKKLIQDEEATMPKLDLRAQREFLNTIDNSQDPIESAFSKYQNRPSIILIKRHMDGVNSSFVFETVTNEKIEKLVTNLNIRKTFHSNDIPVNQ